MAVLQRLRHALRGLARTPTFTGIAIGTLALCVGANSAMFSVVNHVVLQPLPFPESTRLVRVWSGEAITARQAVGIADQTNAYTALAAASPANLTLTGEGSPELLRATMVGAEHFEVFGVPPARGRGLTVSDTRPGAPPVAIVSHELWQRRFGGDPGILGRTLPLGGEGVPSRTVVGVAQPGYRPFDWDSDVFVPIPNEPGAHEYSDMARYLLVGRLSPRVSLDQATTELRSVVARLAETTERGYIAPEEALTATVAPEHAWRVGGTREALWLLMGAVFVVLVIGCVNIASLMLVRLSARAQELSIRRALGAGRTRILGLLLAESSVIGVAGGSIGVLLAWLATPAAAAFIPSDVIRSGAARVDGTVLLFALVISLGATVLFGVLPAFRAGAELDRFGAHWAGARLALGGRTLRLNRVLVAGEIALCLFLVTAAGLLLQSLAGLRNVDPGFDPTAVSSARITPSPDSYPGEEDRRQLLTALESSLASTPGVQHVGAIQVLPMTPGRMGVGISPDGLPVPDDTRPFLVGYRIVSPDYMRTMRIPLVSGRHLEPADRADGPPVGLVNQAMADRLWPGAPAVGRTVHWDNGDVWFTTVGVVADVHQNELSVEPRAEAYVPFAQDTWMGSMYLLVRAENAVDFATIREAIWRVAPEVPVTGESTMEAVVSRSMATPRFHSTLFAVAALLALLLAAVGVYGVTSYVVGMRMREIAIRLACGATGRDVAGWLLRSGGTPILIGVGVGLAGVVLGTRVLRGLLYGVTPTDPIVLGGVVLVLCFVAGLAMAQPTRRAIRVDPMQSLNRE